ncbi:MAG: glycosyltransferase, exosortase A system-associated [Magnetococcales bacterium]|nr:glycosyltransferase, exosortase A system-associated [Magnetococcales bacterium]
MRILHLLDHSAPLQSGYVSRTLAILRQQRAMGWETAHVTGPKHPDSGERTQMAEGLLFHRTPTPDSLLNRWPPLDQLAVVTALAKRSLEVARDWQPDLLHAHSPVLNGLAALRVSHLLGIPLVYEIRAFWEDAAASHGTARLQGPRYRLTRGLETLVMRRADAVTVICEGLRRDIVARGIPNAKITTIPNAVEVERFTPTRPAPPLRLPGLDTAGREVLGYIGSFYAYEGLSLLLDALPAIRARRPDILLLLVGGGPEEERLRQQTTRLGLEGQVHFAGRLPPERMPDCHALVELLLFPRLPMRLTHLVTPLKPLEAMAAHRLVLASDVEGHKELIRHGQTGFLFPAGDARALAETVISLLERRDDWPTVIAQAARFVREERNWSNSVARYAPVYDALTRSPSPSSVRDSARIPPRDPR